MSKSSRRNFIIGAPAAAVAAASLLEGCQKKHQDDPFAKPNLKNPVPGSEGLAKASEEQVTTVCGQCPAGCAISVRVAEGRAVGVHGIEDYPVNHGAVGPKGQSGPEILYHRDRIKTPLKREGGLRSGKLIPATWDEAVKSIGGRLKGIRERNESRSLVIVSGEARGPMRDFWMRFGQAFGTPNVYDHRSLTDGAKSLASFYMQGTYEMPAIDWNRTTYVLGLGSSHLESWCQTIHMMRAASAARRGTPGKRVKFINISPRFSTTSIKADEWFPIEPGTYGSLALGLCHVLIRDRLYDEKFVANHSFGFESFKTKDGSVHPGFKDVVMKEGIPEQVAAITQVPVEIIERLAHELVEYAPAVVVPDPHATASSNGLYTAMAVHALNALLGNIDRQGGVLVQDRAPLHPWKNVEVDAVAKAGLSAVRFDGVGTSEGLLSQSAVHRVPQTIIDNKLYAAQAVFLHYSNPIFSKPGGRQWQEALAKIPLVVSFSPLPDESTLVADWVLPDLTYLERWEYVESAPALGAPSVGLRQPVVKPLFDNRQTGDVVLALAKEIGGTVAEGFAFESYRAALEERLTGLCQQDGANCNADGVAGLIEAMQDKGGWWLKNIRFERYDYPTPSKKFEFFSQAIGAALKEVSADKLEAILTGAGIRARGDALCLPHYEPVRFVGDAAKFPFQLMPYRAINYAEGGIRHSRRLMSLPLVEGNPYLERIELSEEDAVRLNLTSGEKVQVETTAATREFHLMVRPGIRPGTLGLPLGYGQWPPKSGEVSSSYNLLSLQAEDVLGGIFALTGTRAAVRRAS